MPKRRPPARSPSPEHQHPIQVAARRAGVSAYVLRAWEKRYQAVVPGRSNTGRRFYSDEDIERLRLIQAAIAGGRRIGDLARLPTEALSRLAAADRTESGESARPAPAREDPAAAALDAIRRFDPVSLEAILARQFAALGLSDFVARVAAPLMQEVGLLWSRGELTPGYEHLASATLRTVLGQRLEQLRPRPDAPVIVVGTPAGQRHEFGALLAALGAALEGWRPVYLGPDLPAADLAQAVHDTGAVAVAVSLTFPEGAQAELKRLRELLPRNILLLVGGQATHAGTPPTARNIHRVDSLADLRAALRTARP